MRLEAATTPAPGGPSTSSLITLEEVQQAARRRGIHLSVKELGPFYRVVCRDRSEEGNVLVSLTSNSTRHSVATKSKTIAYL